jgi:hypothetical protein
MAGKEIGFDTFQDKCSAFVHIPITLEKAGIMEITIKHPST